VSLCDPVTDGLLGRLKLGGELLHRAADLMQFNDALSERGWIRWTGLGHVDLLCFDKGKIVHQTESTPH
jgi:hypothetical protein